MTHIVNLGWTFIQLSLLAVGGATAVLPQMKAMTTQKHAWITAGQFTQMYSLGQLAPGPNMLMVMMIGYAVAGVAGALVVLVSFFLPSSLLAFSVGRVWHHFAQSPWRASVQKGLAPVTIGLMLSGVIALGQESLLGVATVAMALAVVLLVMVKHVNPALLIVASGAVSLLLSRF